MESRKTFVKRPYTTRVRVTWITVGKEVPLRANWRHRDPKPVSVDFESQKDELLTDPLIRAEIGRIKEILSDHW